MLWGGAVVQQRHSALTRTTCLARATPRMVNRQSSSSKPLAKLGLQRWRPHARDRKVSCTRLYPLPRMGERFIRQTFSACLSDGGRNILDTCFRETALPNAARSDAAASKNPGKPDLKSVESWARYWRENRRTGASTSTKTRLNDPNLMWFMGTNDQPGDYRHVGLQHPVMWCTPTTVTSPSSAGIYAPVWSPKARRRPTDPDHRQRTKRGHPTQTSAFTRSIPTSQCMICHMHQPNMFMNTYLGYTMWDYESDAPAHVAGKAAVYPDASRTDCVKVQRP